MKNIIIFCLLMGLASTAWAQDDNADVIIFHDQDWSCGAVDADGNMWMADCTYHKTTHDDGWINNCKLFGKLPEGAALPEKALRGTIQDFGWGTCCFAEGGYYILSPSGQFTYNCRD